MSSNQAFNNFIQMHRELLDCYATTMNPNYYKTLQAGDQRDFCYVQRVRLEEQLIKGNISVKDFFAAANTNQS